MRLAYLILAHKNPAQVMRLVRALRDRKATCYVHVDAKQPLHQAWRELAALEGVVLIRRRRRIYWGGWSIVAATLKMLRVAVDGGADRLVLLSGQDYPLQPNPMFRERLSGNANHMQCFRLPAACWTNGGMDKVERYHWLDLAGRLNAVRLHDRISRVLEHGLGKRVVPGGLRPFGGSQWWAITRQCAQFVLDYTKQHPHVPRFFSRTHVPDELFFQTIIGNSALHETVTNDHLRAIDWAGGHHPRVLCLADCEWLMSRGAYFARKFDIGLDTDVLDRIDEYRKDSAHSMAWDKVRTA